MKYNNQICLKFGLTGAILKFYYIPRRDGAWITLVEGGKEPYWPTW